MTAYHITLRLGVFNFSNVADRPLAGEPAFDITNRILQIALGPTSKVSFAPVNSTGGMAAGFPSPDDTYSFKGTLRYGLPWGSEEFPALVNYNRPGDGVYFERDVSNEPTGVAISYGGTKRFKVNDQQVEAHTLLRAFAGARITGVAEADDFVLSEINKSLDSLEDVLFCFVYETRLDADGGQWRERMAHTSWYNEPASGTRGLRKKFPSTALIIVRANKLDIHDADDVNLSLWMTFSHGTERWLNAGATGVTAHNGVIFVTTNAGILMFDFPNDDGFHFSNDKRYRFSTPVSRRNDTATVLLDVGYFFNATNTALIDSNVFYGLERVVAGCSAASYIDAQTGLNRGYVAAVAEDHGHVMLPSRRVLNVGSDDNFYDVALSPYADVIMAGAAALKVYRANQLYVGQTDLDVDGYINPSFEYKSQASSEHNKISVPVYTGGGHPVRVAANRKAIVATWKNAASQLILARIIENKTDPNRSMVSYQSADWSSGWMIGDTKGAWLANSKTADRSGRGTSLTENGTVPATLLGRIYTYGPFTTSNYFSAAYGANTISLPASNWGIILWANIPENTTTNQVLFEIASADTNEDSLRLEINEITTAPDPDDLGGSAFTSLILTHKSNGNTLTMKSYLPVDTGDYSNIAVIKRGDTIKVAFNGVFIMSQRLSAAMIAAYRGVQNTSCALYIGKGVQSPAAPFQGNIAMFRWGWTSPTDNQLEEIIDWERAFFLNTAATTEFHLGASPTAIRSVDIDPITDSVVVGTDFGVYKYDGFILSQHYVAANSNLPDNDVRNVSSRAGNMVAATAGGTWVAFPSVSVRENISTTLKEFTPNETYVIATAGGSYSDYEAGSNTITETIIAVIDVPPGAGGEITVDVGLTPLPGVITDIPSPPHSCNGVYNIQPTTVENQDYSTLTGANWSGYVNFYDDLRAEWAKPSIQALSQFRTSGLPDIRKYGKWHYEEYVTSSPFENRTVPPWTSGTVTPVEHNCVGGDDVTVRVEPTLDGGGTYVVVLEHPADTPYIAETWIYENYLRQSGVGRLAQ